MKKNKQLITSLALIILVIIIATLIIKNNKNNTTQVPNYSKTETQVETDLTQIISSDTTIKIDENLKKIDLSDTSDADLNSIDQELSNL